MPHALALDSLNLSLALKSMQYTSIQILYKTYALGINQTSLLDELPFAQIIPQNLMMVLEEWRVCLALTPGMDFISRTQICQTFTYPYIQSLLFDA